LDFFTGDPLKIAGAAFVFALQKIFILGRQRMSARFAEGGGHPRRY
jgi:hypothetical protein